MIKSISNYIIVFGLLLVGHSFLHELFPEKGLGPLLYSSQIFLFLLFVKSHLLSLLIVKKTDTVPGMVFLGFSVVKFIFGGLFFVVIKLTTEIELNKAFVAIFILSYFTYLTMDVLTMIRKIEKTEV